ncbi:MAG: FAD-dependent monooxygenase [Bryobacteraceae bacterium]|nr:FAD-dependent monooxygenase [Bryobacteraceae bacterium]
MDVAIAGGGIGGLTAAIALRRAGVEAHVYEAAEAWRPIGAGIMMPPNAMQVFASLELADRVRAAGLAVRRMELRSVGSGILQTMEGEFLERRYGHRPVFLRRSALHEVLWRSLPKEALHLGHALREVREGEALFSNGASVRARLIIGADGLSSTVRKQLFPEARLRYSGVTSFRGLATARLPEGTASAGECLGGETRFGWAAVDPETIYWFAPFLSPAGVDHRSSADRIADRYAKFPAFVQAMLKATPPETWLQTDLFDLVPPRTWVRGTVALLGDAAHATTPNLGQGGAQAIEDAAALAHRVEQFGLTERALMQYQEARQTKARWITIGSWRFGRIAHLRNPLLCLARDRMLQWAPRWVERRQLDRMFRPEI